MQKNETSELVKVLYHYGIIDTVTSDLIKVVCPFHKDVNPSMAIDLNKGTFFCFGCESKGNAFDFVKLKEEDMNDIEAYLKYIRILKSSKREITVSRTKPKAQGKEALMLAHDMYYGLSKCRTTKSTMQNDDAIHYLLQRGYTLSTLKKAGIKYNYNDCYPLIFPILDNGAFKGWLCRTTRKDVEERRKYLYNTGFRKKQMLCGNYAKNATVVIVEGYMDLLKMQQLGLKNVVAIFGWKISEEQIAKLKKAGIKNIICALDNDECGNKGYKYMKQLNVFNVVRWQYLKGIKDAGEMEKETFAKMFSRTKQKLKCSIDNGTNK